MIYKDFQNDLYLVENFLVTSMSSKDSRHIKHSEFFTTATEYDTGQQCKINILLYKIGNRELTVYAIDEEDFEGKYVLYKDLHGEHLLMRADKFYEEIKVWEDTYGNLYEATYEDEETFTMPRFEKVNDEHLFDIISEKCQSMMEIIMTYKKY